MTHELESAIHDDTLQAVTQASNMINKIIDASLDNRFVVLLLVVLLIAVGLWSIRTLPVDAVSDLTNIQVQVLTTSPSLGPIEMEQFIQGNRTFKPLKNRRRSRSECSRPSRRAYPDDDAAWPSGELPIHDGFCNDRDSER